MTTRAEKRRAQSALGVSNLVQLEVESSSDGRLPKMVYEYYAGGSDSQESLADNRACFSRYKLVPRLLRDVSTVNERIKLFGVSF
jgi:(S)-2-hydroxy-acid oxidase